MSGAQCILLERNGRAIQSGVGRKKKKKKKEKAAVDRSTGSDALRKACRAIRPRISSTNYLIKRRWLGAHHLACCFVHVCVSCTRTSVSTRIFHKLLKRRGRGGWLAIPLRGMHYSGSLYSDGRPSPQLDNGKGPYLPFIGPRERGRARALHPRARFFSSSPLFHHFSTIRRLFILWFNILP